MAVFEEMDLTLFQQILTSYKSRIETYGQTSLFSILGKNNGEWKNFSTRIQPNYSEEEAIEYLSFDYGKILLIQKSLSSEETIKLLERLQKGTLHIPDGPTVKITGNFETNPNPVDLQPSSYKNLNLDWPSEVYHLKSQKELNPTIPRGPLLASGKPFFPSERELIATWCNLSQDSYLSYYNSIVFVLPKYYTRIINAQLRLNEFKSQIEVRETQLSNIIAKLYLENYQTGKIYNEELIFTNPEIEISLDFEPEWVVYYLISKDSDEIFDYRRVHVSWDRKEGVDILPFSDDIEELIQRGEGKHIEFKESIVAGSKIAQTSVAFSNTEGGTILIGVNDNGEVVGEKEDKIHERIANIISDSVDPPSISFEIEEHNLKGKMVYAIRVQSGDAKPYICGGKVYIRRSKTNRIAGKHELDNFYKKEDSPYPRWQ
jgi:hypothetical protein